MSTVDDISNFYEKLVLEEFAEQLKPDLVNPNFLADAACIALNSLPARYFRHSVDMAFYLSADEYMQMKAKVQEAVKAAISKLQKSPRKED